MITDLDSLILALYRTARPAKTGDLWRTANGWFRHVLELHGLKISSRTVLLWCTEGIPDSRQEAACAAVWAIHNEIVEARLDELKALKEAMP